MESKEFSRGANESLAPLKAHTMQTEPNANDRGISYTEANAVALQSQNIVPNPSLKALYSTGQSNVFTYIPTETQVFEYMKTCAGRTLRDEIAEEAARAFLQYNNMKGWKIADWREAARRWISKEEERKGLAIYEDPEQAAADEERRKTAEERQYIEALLNRIYYKNFTDEEGKDAWKVIQMLLADDFTDERLKGIAKKVGQRLIDLWAWTYAEKIIMEDFTNDEGEDARVIKIHIDSGELSSSWYWHGMELKVIYYLERWEKGPGRPIKRLAPIKIRTTDAQEDVPEYWKYLKRLIDICAFSVGFNGPIAKRVAEKAERRDFSGQYGDIARWIATGQTPQAPQAPQGAQCLSGKDADVPELWKYYKTLVERRDTSGGITGPKVKRLIEKVENNDFDGEGGDIARWIVTGQIQRAKPQPPSGTPINETRGGNPKPLKGIINAAMRNTMRQT